MTLPGPVAAGVRQALAGMGAGDRIASVEPAAGGCVNHGARVTTDSGTTLFLKWNAVAPAAMFEAEADGLEALANARTALVVPRPLARGGGGDSPSWLMMEHVPHGRPGRDTEARLGRGLAEVHRSATARTFGWPSDNWIGSLPQSNDARGDWGAFWRERRIEPQLRVAREGGHLGDDVFDRLVGLIDPALVDVRKPELVHGDLWSGNWFPSTDGVPVLIDPAVYHGHGEVDLAMSELFGGFGASFYGAYAEAHPIPDAYHAFRRDLYQLYYLLVHVNMFGASYAGGCRRAAARVVAELA